MSSRTIILAEDNDKLRKMYSDLLETEGFSVMSATDGEKVIGLLHKVVNPKLIILDVMMPNMDGIETCKRIRTMQGQQPIPIMFLTALEGSDSVLECLKAGGDDYLVKSGGLGELLERVRYWTKSSSVAEAVERRKKAIAELETMSRQTASPASGATAAEAAAEQSVIDKISVFIAKAIGDAGDSEDVEDKTLYRFGYVVGIVETCREGKVASDSRLTAFLRKVFVKTGFAERKEVDAMLDNYDRLVKQSKFQQGWDRGIGDAAAAGMAPPKKVADFV